MLEAEWVHLCVDVWGNLVVMSGCIIVGWLVRG